MRPEPIRVLRIITRLNIGGPAREVQALCRGTSADGLKTVLAAGAAAPDEGDLFDTLDLGDVERIRIPGLRRAPGFPSDVRAAALLHRLVRSFRPHVVHTHTSKAGLLGRLVARNQAVPVICHTYHGHVFRGHFTAAWSRIVAGLERGLGRLTDAIVVLGPELKRDLIELGIGRRVVAITPGFDPTRLAALRSSDRASARRRWGVTGTGPTILVMGRLVRVKGIDLLIDVLGDLAAQAIRPFVLVAGDGPQRAELEQRARHLGLGSTVRFLGWVDDIASVLASADLLVMPSRSEGYPHALVEAQAAGLPALVTTVGEVKHIVEDGHTGFLVPPENRDALTGALRRLVTEPDRLAAVRARLASHPRVWPCVGAMVEQTTELYRELLARCD